MFRARDTRLDRDVAIKILTSDLVRSEAARRRFEQDFRAISALSHPNILSILDVGRTEDGIPYTVTELLEGHSLREELRGGELSWQRTAGIVSKVAAGLSAAHDLGIVHCDLKPENVFLTDDGLVKILDFGSASFVPDVDDSGSEAERSGAPAATAHNVGTAAYMAPERLRGEPAGAAADVFSLGCIVHECLTREHPFRRGTAFETIAAILSDDPPLIVTLSPRIDDFLRHCLRRDPAERIDSMAQFLEELERLEGESNERSPISGGND